MDRAIITANNSKDATPCVIEAIKKLSLGGEIIFEKSEYHFHETHAFVGFFAPTNNETGIKKAAFPIINCSNITINGNGSTFIFHDRTSPFIIKDSKNITIKNAVLSTHIAPYALMQVTDKTDDSFVCRFDNTKVPCKCIDGNLVFMTEGEVVSTADKKLSLHSLERVVIRYIYTKDCKVSREKLPAPYLFCEAEEKNGLIKFKYLDDIKSEKCVYDIGEWISINLEEQRFRDVFFLENSDNCIISHITVQRGGGMGIIAQLCHNIEIDNFVAKASDDEIITLTADIIHLVNCSGKVSIHDCDFRSSLDDACNIHGNYSVITHKNRKHIQVEYKHEAHSFLDLYKPGDILTVIDNETLDEMAKITVKNAEFSDDTGMRINIECETEPENISQGFLIESAKRMPDIHIFRNKSKNIPHWRLSGAGSIIVENNEYEDCNFPVYAYDLAQYWYESGRIKRIVIRNNHFKKARFGDGFIKTGVSGYDSDSTPKIHDSITITGNIFEGLTDQAFNVSGFKNMIIKNNIIK